MNKFGDAEFKGRVKQTPRCKIKENICGQEDQIRYGDSTLQRI